MASSGLDGPYPLSNSKIDSVVTKTSAGAYALGKTQDSTFHISYVGRSDDDINGRLHDWVGKYAEFKFGYFPTAKGAYEKECRLWHDFGGPNGSLDNKVHPSKSALSWACPVCGV